MAAPGGSGPIGPFPARVGPSEDDRDAYDRLRRRVLWTLPYGLYVLGVTDGGTRRNGMTVNWVTQVSFDPKWIAVGVERSAYTHELIEAGGVFSLNVIAREDRTIVRKFTKPVEVDLTARTLNGFAYTEGATGAPLLTQAVAWLDCEVRERVPCGGHTLVIGEVVDATFADPAAPEDIPVLRMEDTRMSYGG